jgi:hypothetical protein
VVARRRQGVAGDLEGVTGKVPCKEERAGAQRNGGSMVRWCKRRRAAAFVGREGAPVGGDGRCGVLQHRRGKGARKLQEIVGIGSSGRSSPGSGGRRRCSAGIHEGEWAAGARCRRRRSGCGEWWGGSSAQEEESERSGDGRTSGHGHALSGAVVGAAERERKERGVRPRKCHTARDGVVGPGPDRPGGPQW